VFCDITKDEKINNILVCVTDWQFILIERRDLKSLLSASEVFMKAQKEKAAAAARDAKRRLDNPLTEAEKAKKSAAEVEWQRLIQRTADEKSERAKVEKKRRSAARVGGLEAEATRK
jgi:hypothetical protein